MSRLNANGSRSVSSASCNSFSDADEMIIENGVEELSVSKTRIGSGVRMQKAKRIRFYHNGNKFFNGVVIPVGVERYRTFDSLKTELTSLLNKYVSLRSGVRNIYTMDGKKIVNVDELEDGKEYVCSDMGDLFKKIEYTRTDVNKTKRLSTLKVTTSPAPPRVISPDFIRPRIITIIRNGIKPRKIIRLLLNKRNSSSMEQVLRSLTDSTKLDSGAVRKVFNLKGSPVTDLAQFFQEDEVFFVYGNERFSSDDFELEFEETKAICANKKTTGQRNGAGPKPKMPKKLLNRTFESEGNLLAKYSKDENIPLPGGLKNRYTVGKLIGDGNFAVVRLCRDKIANEDYALKIIDKSKCKGKEDMIENEVKILSVVNHEYIMRLITQQDTEKMLFLVVEWVRGGDLFDAIQKAQKYSEDQASLMMSHLTSALKYLHNLNIVHRDVKPENLLVDFDGDRIKILKLGDFGLACEVDEPLYTVCGTPTYVAPEILAESGYGLKIDIWAAGVIMYILLCGYPPFVSQDNDQEKLFDSILSGQYEFLEDYWCDVSFAAKELIQNMLQLAPELRFSAEDVLEDPWILASVDS